MTVKLRIRAGEWPGHHAGRTVSPDPVPFLWAATYGGRLVCWQKWWQTNPAHGGVWLASAIGDRFTPPGLTW